MIAESETVTTRKEEESVDHTDDRKPPCTADRSFHHTAGSAEEKGITTGSPFDFLAGGLARLSLPGFTSDGWYTEVGVKLVRR